MKFLCVPCDSPMKLQTVGPPERGSLSVVYACPECGYEIAMLTNAYETQIVQSLGVRIGPDRVRAEGATASCPFSAMIPAPEEPRAIDPAQAGDLFDSAQGKPLPDPVDGRRGSAAREHSRVRPSHGADRHRAVRAREGGFGGRRGRPRRGPRVLRDVAGGRMEFVNSQPPTPNAQVVVRRIIGNRELGVGRLGVVG